MERDKRGLSFLECSKPSSSGMGGPSVAGKYINVQTGQEIFVRDCFDTGNGMQCMLSDGNMISMQELSRDYIMMDDVSQQTSQQYAAPQQFVSPVNDLYKLDDEEPEIPVAATPSLDAPIARHIEQPTQQIAQQSSNESMISKILDKSSIPTISITFDWDNAPYKEFAMLKDFFDVTDEEIANAVLAKYGSGELIMNAIIKALNK